MLTASLPVQKNHSNIIASLFGFKPEELFSVESAEARKNVKINFEK